MWFMGAIVIGTLAGIVARLLTPGHGPGGFLVSISLGVIGALAATWIGQAAGLDGSDDSAAVVGAAVGAVAVPLACRLARFRRRA